MKKKALCLGVAAILIATVGFFCFRSIVGWRPYRNLETDDLKLGSLYRITLGKDADWPVVKPTNVFRFVDILNDMKVVPYGGEYDPFDESMMYFVFKYADEEQIINRIGVTLEPEPILTIGGDAYRIDREIAEKYRDFWENFNGNFKVGS